MPRPIHCRGCCNLCVVFGAVLTACILGPILFMRNCGRFKPCRRYDVRTITVTKHFWELCKKPKERCFVPYASGCYDIDVKAQGCCSVQIGNRATSELQAFAILDDIAPLNTTLTCTAVTKNVWLSGGWSVVCLLPDQVNLDGSTRETAGFIMICVGYGTIGLLISCLLVFLFQKDPSRTPPVLPVEVDVHSFSTTSTEL